MKSADGSPIPTPVSGSATTTFAGSLLRSLPRLLRRRSRWRERRAGGVADRDGITGVATGVDVLDRDRPAVGCRGGHAAVTGGRGVDPAIATIIATTGDGQVVVAAAGVRDAGAGVGGNVDHRLVSDRAAGDHHRGGRRTGSPFLSTVGHHIAPSHPMRSASSRRPARAPLPNRVQHVTAEVSPEPNLPTPSPDPPANNRAPFIWCATIRPDDRVHLAHRSCSSKQADGALPRNMTHERRFRFR